MPLRLAIQRRIDIEIPAGDDQRIDPPKIRLGMISGMRQRERQPAASVASA
jgi:hypothetical protein